MITIIACRSINGVIGKDNELVFKSLKKDMKWFSEYTKNKYVVMGRKTWESIPKNKRPLINRVNIIITSNEEYLVPDGATAMNINEFKKVLAENNTGYRRKTNEFVIIGGATLYKEFLKDADNIFLTTVKKYADGDTMFPCFDETNYIVSCLDEFIENIDGVETPTTITLYEKI